VTESGCWIYMGSLNDAGYGIAGLGGRGDGVDRTHRITYRHFNGEIPDGLYVCHRCDVPCCCNPHHLFAGTSKDNHDDMRSKERHSNPPINLHDRGEYRYNAKLSEADVTEMRRMYEAGSSIYRIAKTYGLCQSVATRIVRRISWRHVA
jgi:HNH endonuclease